MSETGLQPVSRSNEEKVRWSYHPCRSLIKEKSYGYEKAEAPIHVEAAKQGRAKFILLGQTPLYYNAMSAKAKRSLLIGGGKKTAAEKKDIKHNLKKSLMKVFIVC